MRAKIADVRLDVRRARPKTLAVGVVLRGDTRAHRFAREPADVAGVVACSPCDFEGEAAGSGECRGAFDHPARDFALDTGGQLRGLRVSRPRRAVVTVSYKNL